MADIRAMQGKLIYELTSADALKDTDLFAVSSNNLTRKISVSQLKLYIYNDIYNKKETDGLMNQVRDEIKGIGDDIFGLENGIYEFINEFNVKLQNLNKNLTSVINEVDKKFTDITNEIKESLSTSITEINNRIDTEVETLNTRVTNEVQTLNETIIDNVNTLNTRVTNEVQTLNQTITDLDTELNEKINSWIQYGTAVPTTLETGRVYVQYFV